MTGPKKKGQPVSIGDVMAQLLAQKGMTERIALTGGQIEVESGPGGTTLVVRISVPQSAADRIVS